MVMKAPAPAAALCVAATPCRATPPTPSLEHSSQSPLKNPNHSSPERHTSSHLPDAHAHGLTSDPSPSIHPSPHWHRAHCPPWTSPCRRDRLVLWSLRQKPSPAQSTLFLSYRSLQITRSCLPLPVLPTVGPQSQTPRSVRMSLPTGLPVSSHLQSKPPMSASYVNSQRHSHPRVPRSLLAKPLWLPSALPGTFLPSR